jgi:hypothetical protein
MPPHHARRTALGLTDGVPDVNKGALRATHSTRESASSACRLTLISVAVAYIYVSSLCQVEAGLSCLSPSS